LGSTPSAEPAGVDKKPGLPEGGGRYNRLTSLPGTDGSKKKDLKPSFGWGGGRLKTRRAGGGGGGGHAGFEGKTKPKPAGKPTPAGGGGGGPEGNGVS